MTSIERFSEGALSIQETGTETTLTLRFQGKSIVRSANDALLPVILDTMERAAKQSLRLVLDFRGLTYMNSSSFAPIIKVLEKARMGEDHVTIIYSSEQKWQEVSFSALTIFQTQDGRITITGAYHDERTQ
ncbi:hypothetical protein [Aquisalimonas asiatica]|uniref:STAS domain-containing protein n=1 Tax=Aquisalimonas asiatica TaxID=406100 RepID=A0A1H8SNE3_9GAMM|nr:hypothetical protein [Aquisalimonas asiatica]SEO80046.1 hypothetical protein SAMN04488052_10384 [Aquisalimonas asiatica]